MAPLNIAIVGVGRIGSTLAFQLSRVGGHKITGFCRPGSKRLEQLREHDGIIDAKDNKAKIDVSDSLDEQFSYDLIIVTLLGHQVHPILPALQRSSARRILFMFNTFTLERLVETIGKERIAFGMAFMQADIDACGRLHSKIAGMGTQKTLLSDQRWVDLFVGSGLPATFEPDMPLWLRCHAPICVSLEAIAVAAHRRGKGASWGEAKIQARGIHAILQLLRDLGYEVYPQMKRRVQACPVVLVASVLWLLSRVKSFRELLATGSPECDAMIDEIIEVADRAGLRSGVEAIEAMRPARDDLKHKSG